MDEVSLLFHIVRDEDLGHENFRSSLFLLLHLSLTAAVHSLSGADIKSLSLILVISLSLLEKSFLGHSKY